MELEFYYDVVCPYAYMASKHVEALAARTGAKLVWKPTLLGGIYNSIGREQSATAGQSPARIAMGALDLRRQAERQGVVLNMRSDHPRRTVNAMRLALATPEAQRPAISHALYEAYWVDGADISDMGVLSEIASTHGVDPAKIKTPEVKQALFDAVDEAVSKGVFGVPGMVVGDKLFWGVDRLHLVEEALGGQAVYPDEAASQTGATLTLYHDFASPYSYLGATQAQRVADKHGVTLEWAPMLLGGLFHAIGTTGIPMQDWPKSKQRYAMKDMSDWARWWGVDFQFSGSFPIHTVAALRVAIIEPGVTPHLYKAAWGDNRNIGDKKILVDVLDEAGFDGKALLEGTADPAVKAVLRENTERAQSLGVCGAPTFVVNSDVVIWGQDRIDQVEAALSGWRPADLS